MEKIIFPKYGRYELWSMFRVWFTNNCIQPTGQSALEDLIDDFKSFSFADISEETMTEFLTQYGITVENGVVINVRLAY